MKSPLQSELKQNRPFRSPMAEAAVAIARTAAVLDHRISEAFRPFGLTAPQYNVLRILNGSAESGLCGREIGERMINQVPDVTRMLDRMEALGLIVRSRDAEDRRHIRVRITPVGIRRIEELMPVLDEIEQRIFAPLGAARLTALAEALAEVRARV